MSFVMSLFFVYHILGVGLPNNWAHVLHETKNTGTDILAVASNSPLVEHLFWSEPHYVGVQATLERTLPEPLSTDLA